MIRRTEECLVSSVLTEPWRLCRPDPRSTDAAYFKPKASSLLCRKLAGDGSVLGTISWEQRGEEGEGTKIRDGRQLGHKGLSLATSSHDCFKISHKLAIIPNDQAAGWISNISSRASLKVTAPVWPRVPVFVFRLGSVRACHLVRYRQGRSHSCHSTQSSDKGETS